MTATDLDIATLRARRTTKWHKFPDDVLPAWVADMDFGVAPSITEAMTRGWTRDQAMTMPREGVLAGCSLRPPHGAALRLRTRIPRRTRWRSATLGYQASFSSVMAFSEPGDAVLCCSFLPISPFMRAIEDTGRRLLPNPMRDETARGGCWTSPRTRQRPIRACACWCSATRRTQPDAPSAGRNWRRWRTSRSVSIWSWCPTRSTPTSSILCGKTHIPLASLHPGIAARTITITSATKSFAKHSGAALRGDAFWRASAEA